MKKVTSLILAAICVIAITSGCSKTAEVKTGTKQRLISLQLKEESLAEYREYHNNVWPELEQAYKAAGLQKLSCFLNGTSLLVYIEYEEGVTQETLDALAKNEVEMRWQAIMKNFADTSFEAKEYEEVYRME